MIVRIYQKVCGKRNFNGIFFDLDKLPSLFASAGKGKLISYILPRAEKLVYSTYTSILLFLPARLINL
jgi:hypothetical protein